MTSRRAQRRDNASTATLTSSTIQVGERWPQFYKLYEHDRLHTVICLPNKSALLEVEVMMQKGKAMCTHRDQLNDCIRIERTTIEEWLAMHPGEE